MSQIIKPCSDCPWRKDAPRACWPPERFEALYTNCQDDGWAMMSCHKSEPGEDVVCAGFVVVIGLASIGVRLATSVSGLVLEDYGSDVDLFPSFDEMLLAQGIQPPARNTVK